MATINGHSGVAGVTPTNAHSGVDDTGRVNPGAGGPYTEVSQKNLGSATAISQHSGVTGYTVVSQH